MSPSTGSGSTSHTGVVHLKRIWTLFYLAIRGYKGLSRSKSRINRGLSLVVLGVIAFLSILGGFQVANPQILTDWIHLKFTLKDMGFSGMLSYIAMVSILPLFSPLTLVIITGSAIFGPVKGFFLSYIGCIINANIAYILVKALSIETPWSNSSRSIRLKKIFEQYGVLIVIGLQLASIIPFTLITVVATGAGMSWKKLIKASSIGVCPGILFYSFMGDELATNMVSPHIYFAGTFAMILLLVVTAFRKRKNSRKALFK